MVRGDDALGGKRRDVLNHGDMHGGEVIAYDIRCGLDFFHNL
jgi:hypothetical protein